MVVFPNAKINIGLNVIGKRSDGFHNIESIFYPIPINDALEAIASDRFAFECEGTNPGEDPETNTILKAYELLKNYRKLRPVHFFLLKNIPQAAGLGGGSADATFTLSLINDLLNLHLTKAELIDISQQVGSDCPFFLQNQPQMVTGRGEELNPIDLTLTGYHFGVINPAISISTKTAYQHIQPAKPNEDLRSKIQYPIQDWPEVINNDFEQYVLEAYPEIKQLKDSLYRAGAYYASLTGSGSAVYGIFGESPVLPDRIDNQYEVFTGKFG